MNVTDLHDYEYILKEKFWMINSCLLLEMMIIVEINREK